VPGARGLTRGAGGRVQVTAIGSDRVDLRATAPGTVDLRVRFTPYWRLERGRGCVSRGPSGWTRLSLRGTGIVRLRAAFSLHRIGATSADCAVR
jgi:hypothetical protein